MTEIGTVGLPVVFDRPCDRVNFCCARSRVGKIGSDNVMICDNCGAYRGRLPHSAITQITAIIRQFGALDTPIIVRAGGRQ
jgi:hypothetical protein